MSDPNRFDDRSLGFSLRKPETWEFVSPAWSPDAQVANASNGSWSWIQANQPFCIAQRLHDSPRHAFSTLKVSARALQTPTESQARALLDMQVGALSKHYAGQFEVREATSDAVIDGHRAIVIRGSFCLVTDIQGEEVPVWLLSRIHVVFAPGRAFSIGMSSSLDESYYLESDFEETIASVRVDNRS